MVDNKLTLWGLVALSVDSIHRKEICDEPFEIVYIPVEMAITWKSQVIWDCSRSTAGSGSSGLVEVFGVELDNQRLITDSATNRHDDCILGKFEGRCIGFQELSENDCCGYHFFGSQCRRVASLIKLFVCKLEFFLSSRHH